MQKLVFFGPKRETFVPNKKSEPPPPEKRARERDRERKKSARESTVSDIECILPTDRHTHTERERFLADTREEH